MILFNNKFKVKICHFSRGMYKIKYSNYRLIPIYKCLEYYSTGFVWDTNSGKWQSELLPLKQAEEVASKLKCIQDVLDYERPYHEAAKISDIRKAEFRNNEMPFRTKVF